LYVAVRCAASHTTTGRPGFRLGRAPHAALRGPPRPRRLAAGPPAVCSVTRAGPTALPDSRSLWCAGARRSRPPPRLILLRAVSSTPPPSPHLPPPSRPHCGPRFRETKPSYQQALPFTHRVYLSGQVDSSVHTWTSLSME
ncbi:Hypothetical predicted protein, partial [Marmota monax]